MALLDAGADMNDVLEPKSRDPKKTTNALLLAVENGHFDLAAALLDRGARPDNAPAGSTALHVISEVRKPIRGDGDPPPAGSGKMTSLDMVRKLVAPERRLMPVSNAGRPAGGGSRRRDARRSCWQRERQTCR